MDNETYLIFRLHELKYGIRADQVREIFHLPELNLMTEAPGDILGTLNYRGKVLPIMHLARRLKQPIPSCRLTDSVIVVEVQGIGAHQVQVGVIVQQVYDVQSFEPEAVEPEPLYGRDQHINTAFLSGIAKTETDMVMLLNPDTLIQHADERDVVTWEAQLIAQAMASRSLPNGEAQETALIDAPEENLEVIVTDEIATNFYDLYCSKVTEAERKIFHQRALDLQVSLENTNIEELKALAVVGLGEEYFGIDLGLIREFINVRTITKIPCCPQHILGDMNLRGEVMTLVDICPSLKLQRNNSKAASKAVVIEVNDLRAGFLVDQVVDVLYLTPSEMSALPTAMPTTLQQFFQGTTAYQENILSILDLPTLIEKGGLMVDQAA